MTAVVEAEVRLEALRCPACGGPYQIGDGKCNYCSVGIVELHKARQQTAETKKSPDTISPIIDLIAAGTLTGWQDLDGFMENAAAIFVHEDPSGRQAAVVPMRELIQAYDLINPTADNLLPQEGEFYFRCTIDGRQRDIPFKKVHPLSGPIAIWKRYQETIHDR